MSVNEIQLKRAYDNVSKDDGYRVLVDRLWPRGVAKEKLALQDWLKAIAPSPGLRKWFAHDRQKWTEFAQRYQQELRTGEQNEALELLHAIASQQQVTLVFAAKDEQYNHAVVLKQQLQSR